jgi:NAD(P)-dependent dehydrogenase (short-subunit alcohol dehydrogenase family)
MACEALAKQGATLLLLARNEKRLDALYDRIVGMGAPTPVSIPLDLAMQKDAQFEELANMIASQLGRLDGVAHFASQFVQLAPLASQSLKDWERAFAVNTLAPFSLTRACLPILKQSPCARVLFAVESHSLQPGAFWGGFTASQSAIPSMAKIFAEEHQADANLRFNVLVPGNIETPMRERTHPGETRSQRRPASELAELLLEYLGAESLSLNGEVIYA